MFTFVEEIDSEIKIARSCSWWSDMCYFCCKFSNSSEFLKADVKVVIMYDLLIIHHHNQGIKISRPSAFLIDALW